MIQVGRDAERVQFVDETAAAGANGRSDIVPLLEHQDFASGPGQYFRRRESRRTAARNHNFIVGRQPSAWQDPRRHATP